MIFAYVDETGDTGDPSKRGSSSCYALGCVLVPEVQWDSALNELVDFRRKVRDAHGVKLSAEIKANYLIRGNGPLKGLDIPPGQRGLIYRGTLRSLERANVRAFTVVVDKAATGWYGDELVEKVWETLFQRLSLTAKNLNQRLMLFHDEGDDVRVRKAFRRARKYLTAGSAFGTGKRRVDATQFIEDAVPRNSTGSYFLQAADMVAYAGWRSYMAPSKSVAQVVPSNMWNHLGHAQHAVVNKYSGGAPGVVVRKR
ncbi:DUF3800 domain-containing protein [Micrococcus luteus]|uniref:DUF3800 domain-containing protein n=1 Tax=Micrococcus luteus TaxID=1270 RepID=UPI00101F49B9|nr:DUF3800 domain-containing protein [Micrococcus luteus]RZB22226.1 DUF3800 domain-containing protein [Micrococcus luteus]